MEKTDEEGSRRAETAENRILVAFPSDNNCFAKLGHGLGDDEFSSTNFHSRRWDECGRTEEDEEALFGWTHITQCRRKSISSDERPSFLRGVSFLPFPCGSGIHPLRAPPSSAILRPVSAWQIGRLFIHFLRGVLPHLQAHLGCVSLHKPTSINQGSPRFRKDSSHSHGDVDIAARPSVGPNLVGFVQFGVLRQQLEGSNNKRHHHQCQWPVQELDSVHSVISLFGAELWG